MKDLLFKKLEGEDYLPVDFWDRNEARGFTDAPACATYAVKCTGYSEDVEGVKHPSDFSIVIYFDKNGVEVGYTGW